MSKKIYFVKPGYQDVLYETDTSIYEVSPMKDDIVHLPDGSEYKIIRREFDSKGAMVLVIINV